MILPLLRCASLSASALCVASPLFAAQQQRLASVDLERERPVRMAETVRPAFRTGQDKGRLAGSSQLHGVTIYFKRTPQQQAELEQLMQEQRTPGSPNFHKWLSPAEYGARFGVPQSDLDKVSAWLRSQGFAVDVSPATHDQLSFSGSVSQIETAFQTEMHSFTLRGETHFSNAQDIALPAALADMVLAVRHLDDFKATAHSVSRTVNPRFTSQISGNTFVTPDDFATIFGVKALYASGFDGSGQTIAVVGRTQIAQSDVDAFRAASNLSQRNVTMTLVPGSGCSVTKSSDLTEALLDVQWSGGVAKNATINYIYVGDGTNNCGPSTISNPDVFDAMEYAINQKIAPVISISYGNCEANFGRQFSDQIRVDAQKAATQGQTIVAASGDNGAADCDKAGSAVAVNALAVDVPAAVPEVTGVGGTGFTADASAKTTFWNTGNNANSGSARSYVGEGAWNDTFLDPTAISLNSSGGGQSSFYTHSADASWQNSPGVPTADHRYVPDVSFPASPNHDGYLICGAGWCSNAQTPYRNGSGNLNVVGGTSVSAPAWAGVMALLLQAQASSGEGTINPAVYSIGQNAAAYASAFHDTTAGDNIVPCTPGSSADCPTGGSAKMGFSTNPGYDEVTGLGSPDAFNFEEAYGVIAKANGKTLTTTTVSGNTAGVATGQNVTFTAAVSGNPSVGNVQFMVDGDYASGPVSISNGQASYTTSFAVAGPHAVGATYFGSGSFAGSNSAPVSFALASSGNPALALSANPTSLTIANTGGSSASSTILAQASNGWAGTLNFTCSVAYTGTGSAGTLPTCAFSSASVGLDASNVSKSTTLVVALPTATGALHPHGAGWWATGSTAVLATVWIFGIPNRRRKLLGLPLLGIVSLFAGCQGVGPALVPAASGGVKSGPYTVTVTATPAAGATTSAGQTLSVGLTVQ